MVALTGPGTPYITPDILKRAATGIDWTSIPNPRSSPLEQAAEQANMCLRATSLIEGSTNQPLRAANNAEFFIGPDWRVTIQNNTNVVRINCSRWPILQVIGAQVSPSFQFPRQWRQIPASQMDVERPPLGLFGASQAADAAEGGQSILLGPGVIDWSMGRNGWRIGVQYVSGWPHTALTADIAAGSQTIQVDDCTGWAPTNFNIQDQLTPNIGATAIVYDGTYQEVIQCQSSTVASGPGYLTLNAPLTWGHQAGTLVTTLPRSVMNAAIDLCSWMALERGATATTVQSIAGGGESGGGPVGAQALYDWAMEAVKTYARVI